MNEMVLVDFSGLAHTCWHPAVAAEQAGLKELEAHKAHCASCGMGDPCSNKPRQYDPKEVLKTNLDLKIQTLTESIVPPPKTWTFVKDGHETRRRAILPQYKGTRDRESFDPRPLAEEYLRSKGFRFAWSPDAEADDAIGTMTKDLVDGGMNVTIVSSDKDMWCLFDPPRVKIYLTTKKEFLTREYMEKRLRVNDPKHVRLVKAIFGDVSDNVPNAAPRMQAHLLSLIKAGDGTIEDFEGRLKTAKLSARCNQLLFDEGGLERAEVNYDVVGLRTDCDVEWL